MYQTAHVIDFNPNKTQTPLQSKYQNDHYHMISIWHTGSPNHHESLTALPPPKLKLWFSLTSYILLSIIPC